jgi:hypothetical protein
MLPSQSSKPQIPRWVVENGTNNCLLNIDGTQSMAFDVI